MLFDGQAGMVTLAQAQAAGLSLAAIRARVASGRWQRIYRGVFATFSGPLSREAVLWAALLACGPDAVLSHFSAAEVVGLTDEQAPVVHVTVPNATRLRPRAGVEVHVSRNLAGRRHPSRVPSQTLVEHTVWDLVHGAGDVDAAFGWVSAACARRLSTPRRLAAAMVQRPNIRWRAEMASALDDVGAGCHSVLERRYFRQVERAHGLPVGERQSSARGRSGRIYRDVEYSAFGTVVELDGRVAAPDW